MPDPIRPGDQPLPVPNDGPSMHDLAADDLCELATGSWAPGSLRACARDAAGAGAIHAARAGLADRKQLGLERYGSILQAHNGRDAFRDLTEELQDAAVYARQKLSEGTHCWDCRARLEVVYLSVLQALLTVCSISGTVPATHARDGWKESAS